MTPLLKQDFIGLEEQTWLYTGAEAPLHRGARAAVEEYLDQRRCGPRGREFNAGIEASCRTKFAGLLNGEAQNIALVSNSSEAIASVLLALKLQPGENIVLHTLEYPSAVLSGLALRESGVELRLVAHDNWRLEPEALISQVDANTRLVISSHVNYISGARIDYKTLYKKLQQTSALFLLDATQSLGVVPVDMNHADFVVSSSYKWLLGFHGAGILALNPRRLGELSPGLTGWRSVENLFSPRRFETIERYADARRFELGFPAFTTLAALNFSTGVLLDCGIERIEKSVSALAGELIEGLRELDLQVMTPTEASQRAGNIAFVCEDGEKLAQKLLDKNVLVWGGDGRLRLSLHGFNDSGDVENALRELKLALHS